ncbi:myrosinase 1-like [Galleria mellonella]|uniref:Myrosinase 1-like n=1 Tax=Galleria mellonella TaxID=7137 RepID=A0ABM3N6X6_GALME|nr:myrosinase 1-like [Galleria mellonella]
MCYIVLIVLTALVTVGQCASYPSFPPGFKFGVATAAYQVEGAWNVSDKGVSIWDKITHDKSHLILDGSSGDVACDSYHLWKRDLEMLTELGVHFYRISLSWPRLLPTGHPNHISEDGKRYYNELIDALLEKGIEPAVTIYHWDMPQHLQDLGGWTNPLIADWLLAYARVVFTLFADRVKIWITINEPVMICDLGYGLGKHAPMLMTPNDIGSYMCNKNLLIAHAKVYRLYDEKFRPKYHGMISIVNHLAWLEAFTDDDSYMTYLAMQNTAGRYSHPIYSKEGGWPPEVERIVAINSERQGYPRSRLPAFTRQEIELVRGTFDFFGLNHYTSRAIRTLDPSEKRGALSFFGDGEYNYTITERPGWTVAGNGWLIPYPEGFRYLLKWIKQEYGDVKILVTENGYSTEAVNYIHDDDRLKYHKDYINQMLLAIKEDGVNVIGYTAWSLMDNFEWTDGYKAKFGLYEVNFTDPRRTRTPRKSAKFYAELIKHQRFIEIDSGTSSALYALSIIMVVIIILASIAGYYMYNRSKARRRMYIKKEFEADYELLMAEKPIIKE